MSTPSVPETRELIRSLNSTTCPACARAKKSRHTLCYGCYRRLPAPARAALYDRVGEGYEEAVADAMRCLGVSTFTLPPPA